MKMRALIGAPILAAVLGTAGLLVATQVIGQQGSGIIWLYFVYQAIALLIAASVTFAVWLSKGRTLEFMRVGDLSASTSPAQLLGIGRSDNWQRVGLTFAVVISLVTAVFLFANYQGQLSLVSTNSWAVAFLLAIPLSLTNALSEEIVTRWSIAEGLTGHAARYAPWVSAAVFGSVHYLGIPGGLIGSIMAAFLAWFLTRSIQDTKGIGWAWIIHVAQDLLIFTATLAVLI
jgi:membrane protease YdiL (CAAX protease family)